MKGNTHVHVYTYRHTQTHTHAHTHTYFDTPSVLQDHTACAVTCSVNMSEGVY